jgi:hypothetical protein
MKKNHLHTFYDFKAKNYFEEEFNYKCFICAGLLEAFFIGFLLC